MAKIQNTDNIKCWQECRTFPGFPISFPIFFYFFSGGRLLSCIIKFGQALWNFILERVFKEEYTMQFMNTSLKSCIHVMV